MARALLALPLLSALAACGPQAPASNGAPYQSYGTYMRDQTARDAELRGHAASGATYAGTASGGTYAETASGGSAAQAGPNTQGYGTDPLRTAGVQASPGNAVVLSDEQSFDAVSARETIESDAARRATQAAAYQIVQPTALPQRSGDTGPNIVSFALETSNAKGQRVYRRTLARQSAMRRNCARYGSSDAAQRAFLGNGGPQRNYQGLDPDGDGFACHWDPAPFRLAAGR